jgi:integral membrane protein (TIGR01906 family)
MTSGLERELLWVSSFLIMALLPVVMILSPLYALISPFYLRVEYSKATFPPSDRFSSDRRLALAQVCVRYLRTDAGIEVLASLQDEEGPLFNERELSHMADVKRVTQAAFMAHRIVTALLLAAGLYLALRGPARELARRVLNASWLTLGIVGLLLVAAAVDFDAVFTGFHRLFFVGDTWRFLYTDTLIQLFPIVFWFDAVQLWVLCVVGEALLVGGAAWWWRRRR